MAKITEQEKVAINALSYDEGKEKLYEVLINICTLQAEQERIKAQMEYLNSQKEALYTSVLDKASDAEKEMKKIMSAKMVCQENTVLENKIDLAKIANLMNTNEKFRNAFVKMVIAKGLSISAGPKFVKQINTAAEEVLINLSDIQSLSTKTEVVLSPITDVVESVELD